MGVKLQKYNSEEQRDAVLDVFRNHKYKYRTKTYIKTNPLTNYISIDSIDIEDEFDVEDKVITPMSLSADVMRVISSLKDREKQVLVKFFGLGDTEQQSLNKISDEMGLGRERIRQIKEKAVRRLRDTPCLEILSKYV